MTFFDLVISFSHTDLVLPYELLLRPERGRVQQKKNLRVSRSFARSTTPCAPSHRSTHVLRYTHIHCQPALTQQCRLL